MSTFDASSSEGSVPLREALELIASRAAGCQLEPHDPSSHAPTPEFVAVNEIHHWAREALDLSSPPVPTDPRIAEIRALLSQHDAADAMVRATADTSPKFYAVLADATMAERAIEDNAVDIMRTLLDALTLLQQQLITAQDEAQENWQSVKRLTAERESLQQQLDALDIRLQAASGFVRDIIEAIGREQPPLEAVVDLPELLMQVVGQIETGKLAMQQLDALRAAREGPRSDYEVFAATHPELLSQAEAELAAECNSNDARLRAALKRAEQAIHSEYCGKQCHPECQAVRDALAAAPEKGGQ
jgi:DNA repair exonuclease SbcCD ATPase subunit